MAVENDNNKNLNIKMLITKIKNENQHHILEKLTFQHESNRLYLAGYTENIDPKKKDTIGTIHIYGTYNEKKAKREKYDVKIYKNNDKNTLYCSCPDCKFNGVKNNTSCKHICFIVLCILKIYDPIFFETKILSEEQIKTLITLLTSKKIFDDKSLVKNFDVMSLDMYRKFTREISQDDECPICYNTLFELHNTNICCMDCKNEVHFDCMSVWLERNNTCVFCRSDSWKYFNSVKNG